MPVNIARLRLWFATAAIVLAAVVAGFYFYGRLRVRRAFSDVPRALGVNIQQSTQGFTLSKSEGGRTLFTVHASRAVQYKESGKAELRDVSIVIYGRQANRYDQIYGADFEYDPKTGDVTSQGEVRIDLEANAEGPLSPDQAPPAELKNPIHVKTSGLRFNARTGLAATREQIEFRVPQASGSAMGASYDSKAAALTLASQIVVRATDAGDTSIKANHGIIAKGPNRILLQGVQVARRGSSFTASDLTVYLRDNNTIERLLATGDVRADVAGHSSAELRAPRAEAFITPRNALRSAVFSGGVAIHSAGPQTLSGTAGKVSVAFAARNRPDKVVASDGVRLLQQPASGKAGHPVEVAASAIHFALGRGRVLQQAVTGGPAKVTVLPAPGQEPLETVATAGQFQAHFNRQNRIDHLTGAPGARVVSSAPGQPEKTSTSDHLEVSFTPAGGIAAIVQDGHFHYSEAAAPGTGERAAWASHARYTPADEVFLLTGSPRVVDDGITTTANTIRLNRRTGNAQAEGEVKSTYSQLKPQPGGALLASSDPIHVTAPQMRASRTPGTAIYSGGARLWQGSSVVEAPVIEFDRGARRLLAHGPANPQPGALGPVTTSFVQQDKSGKLTPVSVWAVRLTYLDARRQARFEGGVVIRGADATLTADEMDVFLQPRGQMETAGASSAAGQIDRIVAAGHVVIEEPTRRATGQRLVFTASQGKFVLSGGSPSIFDAERGKITGGSLTFFNRDDRVLVESVDSSPTVTQTRVAK
jgi:lipopolysaccharide export system protein LptA